MPAQAWFPKALGDREESPDRAGMRLVNSKAAIIVNHVALIGIKRAVACFLISGIPSVWAAGFGTGFAINESGMIVTCAHCVPAGQDVTVLTSDGKSHDGTVVFRDETEDIACVKIDSKTPHYLPIGDSGTLKPLDEVFVFGFPLPSTLGGEISAARGTFNSMRTDNGQQIMQVDVPLNEGNSGGPIVGRDARVVGVAVAKLDAVKMLREQGIIPERINFAIPSDALIRALRDQAIQYETAGANRTIETHRDQAIASTVQIITADQPEPSSASRDTEAVLARACKTYVESGSEPPQQQLSKFSPRADFYDKGVISRKEIAAELEEYAKRWPTRSFTFEGIEKIGVDAGAQLGAAIVSFSYSHRNGQRKAAGSGRLFLIFDLSTGKPTVVAVREHVSPRKKSK